jgi:hypothetical protein
MRYVTGMQNSKLCGPENFSFRFLIIIMQHLLSSDDEMDISDNLGFSLNSETQR